MIEFRNVCKTYNTGTEAIHDVNFKINKGEFCFLVGSSGSGKSTIIKMILKEEEPTKGKIIIHIFHNSLCIMHYELCITIIHYLF